MNEDTQEYERPFLQIPCPVYIDPGMEEYLREQEKKKEEEAKAQNSGSVIIIDM